MGHTLHDRLVDADLGQALEHRGAQLGVVGHRLAAGLLGGLALGAALGGLAGLQLLGAGPAVLAGGRPVAVRAVGAAGVVVGVTVAWRAWATARWRSSRSCVVSAAPPWGSDQESGGHRAFLALMINSTSDPANSTPVASSQRPRYPSGGNPLSLVYVPSPRPKMSGK